MRKKLSTTCSQLAELRQLGLSIRAISAQTGISKSYVHTLLRNFAGEQAVKTMKNNNSANPKRIVGARAPEDFPTQSNEVNATESAEQRIARLEKELAQVKLQRDLYDEIINVAEQKFDIQIRKKAGTKR